MKTIEQFAKDYGEVVEIFTGLPSKDVEDIFLKGAECANRWFNTNEEMPPKENEKGTYSIDVLLKTQIDTEIVYIAAYYNYNYNVWVESMSGDFIEDISGCVIHWRPIN